MTTIAEISIDDHRESISAYRSCLTDVVRDDRGIELFKSGAYPSLHTIYEHAPPAESKSGLQFIIQRAPHILDKLDNLTINDKYGSPAPSSYFKWEHNDTTYGPVTNSTIRYIWNLAYIEMLFENINGMDIIEVGGGYGGLFLTLNSYWDNIKSYTFVDVPEAVQLVEKYLNHTDINFDNTKLNFVSALDIDNIFDIKYDLFISNWAFSELQTRTQDIYLDNIMPNCERGACICNLGADRGVGQRGFEWQNSYEDCMNKLASVTPHMGQTHLPPDAPLLYWGQTDKNKDWMLEMVDMYKHNISVIQKNNWACPVQTTTGWENERDG